MQPALFTLLSAKAGFLSERQTVLTRNVANADTPGYRPRDTVTFQQALAASGFRQPAMPIAVTSSLHIATPTASASAIGGVDTRQGQSYETAPSGNGVVLEEEMQKLAQTQIDHQLTTDLYAKQLAMLKMAVSAGGG